MGWFYMVVCMGHSLAKTGGTRGFSGKVISIIHSESFS